MNSRDKNCSMKFFKRLRAKLPAKVYLVFGIVYRGKLTQMLIFGCFRVCGDCIVVGS